MRTGPSFATSRDTNDVIEVVSLRLQYFNAQDSPDLDMYAKYHTHPSIIKTAIY